MRLKRQIPVDRNEANGEAEKRQPEPGEEAAPEAGGEHDPEHRPAGEGNDRPERE